MQADLAKSIAPITLGVLIRLRLRVLQYIAPFVLVGHTFSGCEEVKHGYQLGELALHIHSHAACVMWNEITHSQRTAHLVTYQITVQIVPYLVTFRVHLGCLVGSVRGVSAPV